MCKLKAPLNCWNIIFKRNKRLKFSQAPSKFSFLQILTIAAGPTTCCFGVFLDILNSILFGISGNRKKKCLFKDKVFV